ncbi:MAG: hypothetical protein K0Q59_2285 [Paenibacillus sp.]|nr:hypothetical protein [Paenibacillus sp.]
MYGPQTHWRTNRNQKQRPGKDTGRFVFFRLNLTDANEA